MNLVTGATGIVGLRLVYDLLKEGEPVRAMRRSSSDMEFVERVLSFYGLEKRKMDSIEWVEGDLVDIDSCAEVSQEVKTIYHAAALVSYRGQDAGKLLKVNAEGTSNLINSALATGVERFCHISSVAALGNEKMGPTDENTHWKKNRNRSIYGMSKFLAEQEVWRGGAEGLKVAVVNPSLILGPSKPDQSSGMLMQILAKGSYYYPRGGIGIVDVRDVSETCLMLMKREVYGERFLLNSQNLTYRELLEISANQFGYDPPRYALPNSVLELAWRLASLIRFFGLGNPKVTRETARNAMKTASYDNEKALELRSKPFIPATDSLKYLKSFLEFGR